MSYSAIILSGGRGERMGGREKGRITIDGETLIERQVRTFSRRCAEIIVVTNAMERYGDLPDSVILIRDERPFEGPLQALLAGLRRSSSEINFLTGVDMPFVQQNLIDYLWQCADHFEVVVPKLSGGLEPLFGFYAKGLIPLIEELIRDPRNGIVSLAERAHTCMIEESEIRRIDPKLRSFQNINTPEDIRVCEETAMMADGGPIS